jgi:hypothetical protein
MRIILAFFVLLLSLGCKKEPPTHVDEEDYLEIDIAHFWESEQQDFVLGSTVYHQTNGDTLTINLLRYYISNFALQREDGSWWRATESYFLVDASDSNSMVLKTKGIPEGKYIATEFMLGVDSAQNVSGAQTGALSPANSMFWSWSTGYIMMKLEGVSPQSPLELFVFHVGGFEGADNSAWTRQFDFNGDTLNVVKGENRKIGMNVFVNQTWKYLTGVANLQIVHTPGMPSPLVTKGFFEGFDLANIE